MESSRTIGGLAGWHADREYPIDCCNKILGAGVEGWA